MLQQLLFPASPMGVVINYGLNKALEQAHTIHLLSRSTVS